jgi:peptide deformylase
MLSKTLAFQAKEVYNYSMAIKKIITVPDPVLRQKSEPVKWFDRRLKNLIKNLEDTMIAQDSPKGVGLSAPQINKSVRVFIARIGGKIIPFVNPQITFSSKETLKEKMPQENRLLEGCLSVPGYWGFVNRPFRVKIEYQDEKGKKQSLQLEGKEAVYVQHEFDHLEGILFVDRILEQGEKIYKQEKGEKGETVLSEVEII